MARNMPEGFPVSTVAVGPPPVSRIDPGLIELDTEIYCSGVIDSS